MRTLSFILAFGFVLAGPSFGNSSDGSLPGAGTFSYTGSAVGSRDRMAHLSLTARAKPPLPVSAKDDIRDTSAAVRG